MTITKDIGRSLLRLLPRRLVVQVPLLFALLLIAAIGGYAWVTATGQSRLELENTRSRIGVMAKNIAISSANYVLSDGVNDLVSLEQLLLKAAEFPGVVRIQVTDRSGKVLGHVYKGNKFTPQAVFNKTKITTPISNKIYIDEKSDRLIYWQPIGVAGLPGWVRIEHDLAAIQTAKARIWRDSLFVATLAILFSVLLIVWLMRRPIQVMQKAADFARTLGDTHGRQLDMAHEALELEELTTALNYASTRLHETLKILKDQKFALDQSSIVSVADIYGCITYANDKFCEISQYQRDELIGLNMHFLAAKYYPEEYFTEIWSIINSGQVWEGELRNICKDGNIYWVHSVIVPFLNELNEPYQYISVQADITKRKLGEVQALKLSSALEQTADAVLITNRKGVIEYVNLGFEQITGYSKEEAIGKTSAIVRSGKLDNAFYKRLWMTINRGDTFRDVFINKKNSGEIYYEEKTITPIKDEAGEVMYFVSTGMDITSRMHDQKRLYHLAHHDILTNLPNRMLFIDRLDQAMARASIHDRLVAVMFLDLDRFKVINDTLGHNSGDTLLRMVADRLMESVRPGDTVARFGGDEFTILFEDIASQDDLLVLARKIIYLMTNPFIIEDRELFISTSIGISVYPNDGNDSITLLKNADNAMYRAKDEGRNNFQFYASEMDSNMLERLDMETSLRYALERKEFVLHYQPQIDLLTGNIIGIEALIRWQSQDFGLVPPDEFIPILEETGMIIAVGKWVLKTACADARRWMEAGFDSTRVAVNLSANQFNDSNLVETIRQILLQTGLPAHMLELEITEGIIMQQTKRTKEALEQLNAMGTHIAIDDFGTGYSSLGYLKRFSIDTLKIDRSFIQDVSANRDDAEIVKAILALALSLNFNVVAEGVENEAQLAFLRLWKCQSIQGYIYSKPLPFEESMKLIQNDSGQHTPFV